MRRSCVTWVGDYRLRPARCVTRHPGKSGKKSRCGVQGVWGAIFNVNLIQRTAQKLRRIILLHFGQVVFRIHFRRTRKPLISIVFGRDHDSQNQYYLSLETPEYSKEFKKYPEPFHKISFLEIWKL